MTATPDNLPSCPYNSTDKKCHEPPEVNCSDCAHSGTALKRVNLPIDFKDILPDLGAGYQPLTGGDGN